MSESDFPSKRPHSALQEDERIRIFFKAFIVFLKRKFPDVYVELMNWWANQ